MSNKKGLGLVEIFVVTVVIIIAARVRKTSSARAFVPC